MGLQPRCATFSTRTCAWGGRRPPRRVGLRQEPFRLCFQQGCWHKRSGNTLSFHVSLLEAYRGGSAVYMAVRAVGISGYASKADSAKPATGPSFLKDTLCFRACHIHLKGLLSRCLELASCSFPRAHHLATWLITLFHCSL